MITEDQFCLRPIWDESLKIYEEIAQICDRHGLRYYATDGTELGAVRHKGFIPWDDDFDLSMPRPDYEKFKIIALKELPSYLKFVDWKNTPEMPCIFGKVQDVRRERVEAVEREVGHILSNGLFVDIFPIDGCPSGFWGQNLLKLRGFLLRQLNVYISGVAKKQGFVNYLKYILRRGLALLCPHLKTRRDILAAYESLAMSYKYDKCKLTGRTCSDNVVMRRKPIPKEAWGEGMLCEFYDRTIRLPANTDLTLKSEYYKWDYMQLPPESQRHPTHTFSEHFPWWLGPTTCTESY